MVMNEEDLIYRLRKRAEIRRQIPGRKSVEEGKADRIADLLEEAADYIDKREWVGLTDEELSLLWLEYHGDNFIADGRIINYEKAIEAKLKEKNT
jgi:hypothetical protein